MQAFDQLQLDDWNRLHPVGSDCYLKLDDGTLVKTKTRTPAWLASGFAIASVNGKAGGWDLDRILFPYFVTFPVRYYHEAHTKHPKVHPDGYMRIIAYSERHARALIKQHIGGLRNWLWRRPLTVKPPENAFIKGELETIQ